MIDSSIRVCKIEDGLWQTGTMRANSADINAITETVDILLVASYESFPLSDPNITTIQLPFDDSLEGVPPQVFTNLTKICKEISTQNVVTVCSQGENRSGLLSALILYYRGHTMQNAIDLIRDKVPAVSSGPHALWNGGFVKQLMEYAE